ncbi:hypothetical protein SDC9_132160 [bioreactor metagenome]|uniref:Uncharacterized protein n=1 Tax=bioreactor metagenome TaxID=1076179 RepID=A0A645D808_9ZZZZ
MMINLYCHRGHPITLIIDPLLISSVKNDRQRFFNDLITDYIHWVEKLDIIRSILAKTVNFFGWK